MGSIAGAPAGPAPGWWRLELASLPELEESLLWKLGALGIPRVAVQHRPEAPGERQLIAWLPASDWPEPERGQLELALASLTEPFGLALPPLRWSQQAEEDWSLSWKQHWQADPVGQQLLILPAWLPCPPEHAGRQVIAMDPGSAFGTGSHPTTRLCLEALESLDLGGWRVADLGCGSGVLGLAALRLGASSVAAADTDSLAVRATSDNAALNGLVGQVRIALGSADTLAGLLEGQPADLLLCNILAPVIQALCPAFHTLLAPEGVGLLSGLLVDQAPALQETLLQEGWRSELTAQQSQWGLLTIRRVA
jgi:ribosomal protein L11 methyltransferase